MRREIAKLCHRMTLFENLNPLPSSLRTRLYQKSGIFRLMDAALFAAPQNSL
jgi:hypothetical protein